MWESDFLYLEASKADKDGGTHLTLAYNSSCGLHKLPGQAFISPVYYIARAYRSMDVNSPSSASSVVIPTDEELVARCKTELPHETHSYEVLVQRHMNRVYNIVYRVVNQKEEAEDITQEVFVKVYNSLRKFDQKSSFSTWLYRIATNSALDAFDKLKRHGHERSTTSVRSGHDGEDEIDALSLHESPTPGPEAQAVQAELRECIQRVLRTLDLEHRRMLLLRDFEDLSYDEIANIVEARLSAVKMRIHRARLAFQNVFNQFCGALYFSMPQNQGTSDKAKKGEA